MSNELILNKRQRGVIKAQLTRIHTFVNTKCQEINSNVVLQLKERLKVLEHLLEEFNKTQFLIETLLSEDINYDQTLEEAERDTFEASYYDLITKIKGIIQSVEISNQVSNEQALHSNSSLSNSAVKLPTIELPSFGGKYENYLEFRDAFEALVNQNESLTEIQKFYYLRFSLKSGAEQIIQNLEITAENYKIAWNLLKERYENNKLIIYNHIDLILTIPIMVKESFTDLRNIVDGVSKHLRSLQSLGLPTKHWDALITHIILKKLDLTTRKQWESRHTDSKLQTWEELRSFLNERCDILEKVGVKCVANKFTKETKVYLTTTELKCLNCKGKHSLYACEKFISLPVEERIKKLKSFNACLNCFRTNHFVANCKSRFNCKKCSKKHHTLLHIDQFKTESTKEPSSEETTVTAHVTYANSQDETILATVLVNLVDSKGQLHQCRAVLDSCSQSNFLTEECCARLNLRSIHKRLKVRGIGQSSSMVCKQAQVMLQSRIMSYKQTITCFILPELTGNLPIKSFSNQNIKIPLNITLADPTYNQSGMVDMLIGAGLFWDLLCVGQINLGPNKPVLQKTKLGWVIGGNLQFIDMQEVICNFATSSLEDKIEKFWSIEEVNNESIKSLEFNECDENFKKNTIRDKDERFTVSIPLKKSPELLGESYEIALKRFQALERKFQGNDKLQSKYKDFMKEYESLGHMTQFNYEYSNEPGYYFMPHHGVVREESSTTKLRVVFDASAKTTSGWSFNDLQINGPTIQNDLLSIILRFRKYTYVLSADIKKMYRQVMVEPSQRSLQCIIWREQSNEPLQTFKLNTVTYGTTSAPYLAIRCLYQLGKNCEDIDPIIADNIKHSFYVDDFLSGADNEDEAIYIGKAVMKTLKEGCFELHKWNSNSPVVLNAISGENQNTNAVKMGDEEYTKTLGLVWSPINDILKYKITIPTDDNVTKRTILSTVAQIYDPLGLLSPVITYAKLVMQELWKLKSTWDESVPMELYTRWIQFRNQLPALGDLTFERKVLCKNPVRVELHGFSDASEKAYAACVYIKSINEDGNSEVQLLCAKTRIAPLKKTTIPRLELCGVLLLAELVSKVKQALKYKFHRELYWCDATIVLHWIKGYSDKWNSFVSNRVSKIQSMIDVNNFFYVPTESNPADIGTRGILPKEFVNSTLWQHGPTWLSEDDTAWPSIDIVFSQDNVSEEKRSVICMPVLSEEFNVINKFSCLFKLQRVIAYCMRFINNSRTSKSERQIGLLTTNELQVALTLFIKVVQNEVFANEIKCLTNSKLPKTNNLLSLNPFVDESGILRVGGRLHQSKHFSYSKKHPIILPAGHTLTKLIIKDEHRRLLHCGPQALLASIRERYWPISAKSMIRKILHECKVCFKVNPKNLTYLMGNLPHLRITEAVPFMNVGLDYAGPILIKDRFTRSVKNVKSYIVIFVCLATKAYHLELVTDLSTQAFISALRRFAARRGKPINIFSDNAKNFVGANLELRRLYDFLETQNQAIHTSCLKDGFNWHFIPPRAPNFGGLWEAGVKGIKYHLKRVVGNALLTYEQLITVLVQIESVLNSRPLTPISSDPDDLEPLTPAHFLVGRKLTSLPDRDLLNVQQNRLKMYQRLQQILQSFWHRWNKEYIHTLQVRSKWKINPEDVLKPGTLVLIKEDNTPPLKWQLGRILTLHPGQDGITRVASVKTSSSTVKRAVSKLCAVPSDE